MRRPYYWPVFLLILTPDAAFAGVGADTYGTREPATCPDRSGPLTAETAVQYFTCDNEQEYWDQMYLVTDVRIQLAPNPRPFNIATDSFSGIDPSQPVYDIRGSFRHWQCSSKTSLSWENSPGAACNYGDEPQATGECYMTTFAEWHCTMIDVAHAELTVMNVAPPDY